MISILAFAAFVGLVLIGSEFYHVSATEETTSTITKDSDDFSEQEDSSNKNKDIPETPLSSDENLDSIVIRFLEDLKVRDYQIVKYFENYKDKKVSKDKAEQFTKKIYKEYTKDKAVKNVELLNQFKS